MKKDKKNKCNKCGKLFSRRKLKKINNGLLCPECIKKKRKKHREFLKREIIGIRKRRRKVSEIKKDNPKPVIKGAKVRRVSRKLHLYLTKQEKQFLYKKHINEGDNQEEALRKVDSCAIRLSKLIKELKEKGKSEEEINRRFKEEFRRLCESG